MGPNCYESAGTSWLPNPMEKSASQITSERLGFCARKPSLSDIYREWYVLQQMNLSAVQGDKLELGSGAGFIKQVIPDVITSDVIACDAVDLRLDALNVGSRLRGRLSNLLMVNVFHHINDSQAFLLAASSALRPGGRLIMIEPWLNSWSSLCYRIVGHEPFNPKQEGWVFPSRDPLLDSNQAQAWIVFQRDRAYFEQVFPSLRIITIKPIMPFAYLVSGGHSTPVGISRAGLKLCRQIEAGWLDRCMGMFALVVIEQAK